MRRLFETSDRLDLGQNRFFENFDLHRERSNHRQIALQGQLHVDIANHRQLKLSRLILVRTDRLSGVYLHLEFKPDQVTAAILHHKIEKAAEPGKKAVIVGGGPGGMEAARVCALRGHDVVLFEATNRLGGQVLLAAKASWRTDMQGIVDWLESEINLLGVTVRTNCYAEREEVLEENPDVIVIASGGLPDIEAINGTAKVQAHGNSRFKT